MTAAEQILLSLDAHECWAPGARVFARRKTVKVEPVVVHRGPDAAFGGFGGQSVSELQSLMAMWQTRMKLLADKFNSIAKVWQSRNSAAFTDWMADWVQLQNRYNAAMKVAQSAGSLAGPFLPVSMIPAQAEYDGLSKAMRQCSPPDGCPVSKGDWDDLFSRITAAAISVGASAPVDAPAQPTGIDLGQQLLQVTAPYDVIAQVTGLEKPKVSGLGFAAWLVKHKTAVIVTGVVVVGGVAIFSFVVPALSAAKGMAVLAA